MTYPRITGRDGVKIPVIDRVITVEEDTRCQVRPWRAGPRPTVTLGDRELLWDPESASFPFDLGYASGLTTLRILAGDEVEEIAVRVTPRQTKVSDEAWLALLRDLERWLGGLTVGVEGPRQGSVSRHGSPASFLVEALLPLLPALERAVRAVIKQPRMRQVTHQEDTPLRNTRRVDRETLCWLGRHPEAAQWLDPWRASALAGPEPFVPQRLCLDSLNHPVNRYLAWLLKRVIRVLERTVQELRKMGAACKESLSQGDVWCGGRAHALERGAQRLERIRRLSFLRDIQPAPPSEAALLVLLDDPAYARVHAMGRLFLSPRFSLESREALPQAAVRPTFHLYELWCFLALKRQLQALLPDGNWTLGNEQQLHTIAGSGSGAFWRWEGAQGELEVLFNPTFRGYFNRGDAARWSLSTERRPDICLTWAGQGGERGWICLDAKYRVGRQNLGDAMSKAHIYRDALRHKDFGGSCAASLLLSPAITDGSDAWFDETFRNDYGVGVHCLAPGNGDDLALARWLMRLLKIPSC